MEIVEYYAKVHVGKEPRKLREMYATGPMDFAFCRLYPFSHQPYLSLCS